MRWRLALDMGTNSLGWAAFNLTEKGEPTDLLDTNVRIFSDGREPAVSGRVGDSLAVERRQARGARRTRDRRQSRKRQVLNFLVIHGLMPDDKRDRKALEKLDPYQLRAEAVERPLTPFELGRVIMQLAQRRGFKSNRKSDNDDETGIIKKKITALKSVLGEQTLGQWLYDRAQAGKTVRFHADDDTLYWPDRAIYLDEFDAIRARQAAHHALTEEDWEDLRNGNRQSRFDGLYFQRKLKPVERGRCEFFIEEYRAHRDLPVAHEFRILQDVGNLEYYDGDHIKYKLSGAQRSAVIKALMQKKSMSFNGIRKLKAPDGTPYFPRECRFNLENSPKDTLKGHQTAFDMRSDKMLGTTWDKLDADQQNDLIEALHDADDNAKLIDHLQADFPVTAEEAKRLSTFKLAAATSHLSRKFMTRCTAIMRDEHMGYADAVAHVYDDDGVFFTTVTVRSIPKSYWTGCLITGRC